jgi:hypothetical protein
MFGDLSLPFKRCVPFFKYVKNGRVIVLPALVRCLQASLLTAVLLSWCRCQLQQYKCMHMSSLENTFGHLFLSSECCLSETDVSICLLLCRPVC